MERTEGHPYFTVRKFPDGVAYKSDLEQLQPNDILFKGNHIGVWTGSMIAEADVSEKVYSSCDFGLKKCPFCGGEAEHIVDVWDYIDRSHLVRCKNPECNGWCVQYYDTEEEAVKAWNTRKERTCHNLSSKYGEFLCSECRDGLWTGLDDDEIAYCPHCGAKVMGE